MGRKSLRDSTHNAALDELLEEGMNFDLAWELATEAADAEETERSRRRRAQSAKRQERYRTRLKWISGIGPVKKLVTLYLPEEELAALDGEAEREKEGHGGDLSLEHWRSVVVIRLLCQLLARQEERVERMRRLLSSGRLYIQSQRAKGVPDADIQRDIESLGITMTLDEVMNASRS